VLWLQYPVIASAHPPVATHECIPLLPASPVALSPVGLAAHCHAKSSVVARSHEPKGVREVAPEGVSHRETTRDERMRIIALKENAEWNWSQIGRELNINRRTCERIYRRWKAEDTPSNRKRSGRPVIFDVEEKARLGACVTRDARTRRLSWEAIVLEMGYACSARTVKNMMQKMGYHKRVPRKKFHVSPENKEKRVVWCQLHACTGRRKSGKG